MVRAMSGGFFQKLKRAVMQERPLHELDRRMAKQHVKKRLAVIFPELRGNPKALEEAYRSLDLQPREGTEDGEAGTYYEMRLPL
jgi:hypothetical protein